MEIFNKNGLCITFIKELDLYQITYIENNDIDTEQMFLLEKDKLHILYEGLSKIFINKK